MNFFSKQNIVVFVIVFISVTALIFHLYNMNEMDKMASGPQFVKVSDSAQPVTQMDYTQPEYSSNESPEMFPVEYDEMEKEDEGERLKYLPSTNIDQSTQSVNSTMKTIDGSDINLGDAFSENKKLKEESRKKPDMSWIDSLPLPSFFKKDNDEVLSEPMQLKDDDLHLLARMIQAEAGGESYKGKLAVGAVILNRVKDGRFPNTVKGVISSPGQFEPYSNGRFQRVKITSSDLKAAKEAMQGKDPTKGAVFFYAPTLTPLRWHETLTPTVTIGNHRFFR